MDYTNSKTGQKVSMKGNLPPNYYNENYCHTVELETDKITTVDGTELDFASLTLSTPCTILFGCK